MREITLEELLVAGCHFGHVVTRQNPKAREFIFEARENIHIIDLAKTREGLVTAGEFVRDLAKTEGASIIFVGTKKQAQGIIKEEAKRCGVFYVDKRWIGGTISNFEEVNKNFKKLKDLKEKLSDEKAQEGYTKREIGLWERERGKLEELYGGIYTLEKIPDALFIADVHKEIGAVKEAARRGVTIVGIVDTNADPTLVDYPIPANDDAVGSIKLITSYLADAWIEGKSVSVSQPVSSEGAVKRETKTKPIRAATTKTKTDKIKEVKNVKRKSRTTKKTT